MLEGRVFHALGTNECKKKLVLAHDTSMERLWQFLNCMGGDGISSRMLFGKAVRWFCIL